MAVVSPASSEILSLYHPRLDLQLDHYVQLAFKQASGDPNSGLHTSMASVLAVGLSPPTVFEARCLVGLPVLKLSMSLRMTSDLPASTSGC